MRILHILHEFPYPPNSGVRCDMWRRLLAFKELGHEVMAIAWVSERAGELPSASEMEVVRQNTDRFMLLTIADRIATKARRLWNLRKYPSYIASRIPPSGERRQIRKAVEEFSPDLIWVEGVHPTWLALDLKARLGIPLAYRSHNIEARYVKEQASLARSPRLKLALLAGTLGLEKAERAVLNRADHIFDISMDDLSYWRSEGIGPISWLAPQADSSMLRADAAHTPDIDLLFVGSLVSPNNIAGLLWYLDEVHPKIQQSMPDVRVVVAGRSPPPELAERLAASGVDMIADPVDVTPLFRRARVMLNPILHGSGINIKTIDMLATGQPVLTTTKGARGLPEDVVAQLLVADDPHILAKDVVDTISLERGGQERAASRMAMIAKYFGTGAVAEALAAMRPAA